MMSKAKNNAVLTPKDITQITPDNMRKRQDNAGTPVRNDQVAFWINYHTQELDKRQAFLESYGWIEQAKARASYASGLKTVNDAMLNAAVEKENLRAEIKRQSQYHATPQHAPDRTSDSLLSRSMPHGHTPHGTQEKFDALIKAQRISLINCGLDPNNSTHSDFFTNHAYYLDNSPAQRMFRQTRDDYFIQNSFSSHNEEHDQIALAHMASLYSAESHPPVRRKSFSDEKKNHPLDDEDQSLMLSTASTSAGHSLSLQFTHAAEQASPSASYRSIHPPRGDATRTDATFAIGQRNSDGPIKFDPNTRTNSR